MSVLAEREGRGDVRLLRGVTNSLGVLWERDSGDGFKPVDLTPYDCTFVMKSPLGDTVYSRACDAHGVDGLAAVTIPADAFTADVWASRLTGEWRMKASTQWETILLGWGYWHLA